MCTEEGVKPRKQKLVSGHACNTKLNNNKEKGRKEKGKELERRASRGAGTNY